MANLGAIGTSSGKLGKLAVQHRGVYGPAIGAIYPLITAAPSAPPSAQTGGGISVYNKGT